jgi:hypothetical protein
VDSLKLACISYVCGEASQWQHEQYTVVSTRFNSISQVADSCLPVDRNVTAKVSELVAAGVTRIPEIQRNLKSFIHRELFKDQQPPPLSNSRYWPSNKCLMNAVYRIREKSWLVMRFDQLINHANKATTGANFIYRNAKMFK